VSDIIISLIKGQDMKKILEYQEIDTKIKDIDDKLKQSPERKKYMNALAFAKSKDEAVKNFDAKTTALSGKLDAAKAGFEKNIATLSEYKGELSTLDSSEEAAYFQKALSQTKTALETCERDLVQILREMEETKKQFEDFKTRLAEEGVIYNQNKPLYEAQKKEADEKTAEIKAALLKAEAGVSPELLSVYNKKKAENIFPVFVPLKKDMCGGCFTNVPLNEQSKLKREKMIDCEKCRRIIYIID